jgi:hypothetical protein
MPVLEKRYDSKGNEVGVTFCPTGKMMEFAMRRSSPKNIHKTNEEIFKEIGLSEQIIRSWQNKYNPHFDEWLAEALETYSAPLKEALYAVGVKHALAGDFNFWKPMAQTHGVISNEVVELNVVSKEVKKLSEMTPEQLAEHQKSLMAAISEDDTGDGEVAYASSGEEQGSNSNGDKPL